MCSTVNSLPCPLCSQPYFPSVDSLRIGLVEVTNRPLSCPICNEILIGLDKLTIHLFTHSSLAAVHPHCDACNFTFSSPQLLNMHIRLVHTNSTTQHQHFHEPNTNPEPVACTTKAFQCHICAKEFQMSGSLKVHMRVVHLLGAANRKAEQQVNYLESDEPTTSTTTTTAPASPVVTSAVPTATAAPAPAPAPVLIPVPVAIVTEPATITAYEPDTLVEAQLSSPQTPETASDSTKPWECDVCSKSFTTKYFLKKHKRLHTGEMPYACPICGKSFTFQQSYHKHILYHNDEKPHPCTICGRTFKELSTLHNHERIHTGEKPFKCETCGKCFRQRVSYLVHRRIHTGAMPYRCTSCNKSFRYKVSQRTHKCCMQPPGTVVREAGGLIQKLLQNSGLIQSGAVCEVATDDISAQPDLIDFVASTDIAKESFNQILIGNRSPMQNGNVNETSPFNSIDFSVMENERTTSVDDKLQCMSLYSPNSRDSINFYTTTFDTVNEDSFKQLLYGNENS